MRISLFHKEVRKLKPYHVAQPADFGWTVDWRYPEVRADWYHNMSSVEQAGPCYTSNQLDYDEEVVYQAHKYIWKRARMHRDQPFCLTVSMTHPHGEITSKQRQSFEDLSLTFAVWD